MNKTVKKMQQWQKLTSRYINHYSCKNYKRYVKASEKFSLLGHVDFPQHSKSITWQRLVSCWRPIKRTLQTV